MIDVALPASKIKTTKTRRRPKKDADPGKKAECTKVKKPAATKITKPKARIASSKKAPQGGVLKKPVLSKGKKRPRIAEEPLPPVGYERR
ncbi:hypothetical protein HC762_00225, partial [bacterium]|nr:hypothetical protein [bacterium]